MDAFATTGQGLIGNNSFIYCLNNPVHRYDVGGCVSEEAAAEIIEENLTYIKDAAEEYDIYPVAIAACIYIEQVLNVDLIDTIGDSMCFFLDTSIGVGQVKVSTAKMLEDSGLIEKTEADWLGRDHAIAVKLKDPQTNIRYVAAYLKYIQDTWAATVDISRNVGVLVTLYNIGTGTPHENPKPGKFGEYYYDNYRTIHELLDTRRGPKRPR